MSAFRIAIDLRWHLLFFMYSRNSCAAKTPTSFSLRSGHDTERVLSGEEKSRSTELWLSVASFEGIIVFTSLDINSVAMRYCTVLMLLPFWSIETIGTPRRRKKLTQVRERWHALDGFDDVVRPRVRHSVVKRDQALHVPQNRQHRCQRRHDVVSKPHPSHLQNG